METNNFNYVQSQEETKAISKTFMSSVFSWMFAALAITAVVAYYFGLDESLKTLLRSVDPATGRMGLTGLGIAVMFSPLAFILVISFGFNRLSYPVLLFIFLLFSAVMGMSMSFIFEAYTASSIYGTFIASSAMFGVMALVGYTTKTDLTKFGSIMIMGLVGLIIAQVVNMFMHSSGLDAMITFIGVLVFTGLTAYDVQKLKNIGLGIQLGTAATSKLIIMGALNLYMDFINLFMFLLRFMGNRK